MSTVNIDYSSVTKEHQEKIKSSEVPSNVISTPLGLAIFEIQGELNLPSAEPHADANPEYKANFAKVDEIYNAVKFGRLVIDKADESKVTLFIGKSQRLLGKISKLDPPLGVLRLSSKEEGDIKMIDIVRQKVIFKDRPLPIM